MCQLRNQNVQNSTLARYLGSEGRGCLVAFADVAHNIGSYHHGNYGRTPPIAASHYDVNPVDAEIAGRFTPMITPLKPRRSEIPSDANLCEYCTAKCCRYFALPIDEPETFREYEFIRWFLLHERASVFVEDDTWYLLVHTVCKHLQDDHRSGIYETRPQICREYTTDGCEYEDSWTYDHYFETAEQVHEYAEALFTSPESPDFRSPRPRPLNILQ